jgi:hypothetical protein
MRAQSVLLACASLFILVDDTAHTQNKDDCNSVQFSDDILSRFPNAADSCLDVISREGQEYAVFRVQLERVRRNTLHVRFHNPDGSRGPRTRIDTQPDFRVLVEGEPTRVRDLAANQELTAYVRVDSPMVALAPATQTEAWHVVPLVLVPANQQTAGESEEGGDDATRLASADSDPAMPDTAGPAPFAATVGLLFVMTAVGARAIRGTRSLRRRRMARIP